MQLNSQQKILINYAIFALLVAGLVYFIILPSVKNIYSMGNMINEQRQDLEEKYKKGQSIRTLNKNLTIIEPKIDLLNQAMLDYGTEFDFITSLESLAEKNNVDIKINLGESKKNKLNYYTIPLTINASGKYINLLSFVNKIEELNYYINIDSLDFSRLDDIYEQEMGGNTNKNISLTISAKSFWK